MIASVRLTNISPCFNRSWERVFLYTNDLEGHVDDDSHVTAFLTHPDSIQLLSQSLNPFARPSPKSKSEFDSKTAAIHVETNSKSFDLNEIKADAQWLSQKAEVDEITALRIVVLEWQNRPATRLTSNFSSEEVTSVQNATGIDNFSASVAGANLANIIKQVAGNDSNGSFDSDKSRRLRLFCLFLSERSHILKTARKLFALSSRSVPNESTAASHAAGRKQALCKLGASIFKDNSTGSTLSKFLEDCMAGISDRLTNLKGEGGWLRTDESNEDTEGFWRTIIVEEIVHILQSMFHQLHVSTEVPSGDLLLSWLKLMDEHNFLSGVQVVSN